MNRKKLFKILTGTLGFLIGTACIIVPAYLILKTPNPSPYNAPTIKNVLAKDPTALADNQEYNFNQLPFVTMTTSTLTQQAGTFMQMEIRVQASKKDLTVVSGITWNTNEWNVYPGHSIPPIGNYLKLDFISTQGEWSNYILKWVKAINFDTIDSEIVGKSFELSFMLSENPDDVYKKQITIQQPTSLNLAIDDQNSYQIDAKLQYDSIGTNQTQYIRFYSADSSIFMSPRFNVYFCSEYETYGQHHDISQLSSYFGGAPISFSWEDRANGVGKVELAPGGNITLSENNNAFAIGASYTFAHDDVGQPDGIVDTGLMSDIIESIPTVRSISILRNTYMDELTVTGNLNLELGAGGVANGHNTVTLSTTIHNPVIAGVTIADPILSLPSNWASSCVQYFSTESSYVPELNISKTSNTLWTASVTLNALANGFDNSIINGTTMNIGISVQPTEQSSPIIKSQVITFDKNTIVSITDTATVEMRSTPTAGYVSSVDLTYNVWNYAETIMEDNWVWSGSSSNHNASAPSWTNSLVQINKTGPTFSVNLTAAAATDNALSYAPAYLWLKTIDYTNHDAIIWSSTPKQFNLTPQSSIILTDTTSKFLSYNAVTSEGTDEAGIARFLFTTSNSAQTIAATDITVKATSNTVTDEDVYSNGAYGNYGTIYAGSWDNKINVAIESSNIVIKLRNVDGSGSNPVGPITLSVKLSCTDSFVSTNTLTSATGTTQITLQGGATLAGAAANENFIYTPNGSTAATYNDFTLTLVNMSADQISTSNLIFTHTFAAHSSDTITGLPSYMECIKLGGSSQVTATFRIQFTADYKQSYWNTADHADYSNISFSVQFNGTDTVGSSVASNTLSTNASPANNLGAAICESIGNIVWDQNASTHYDTIAFENPVLASEGNEAHHRKVMFSVPGTYNFTPTSDNIVAHLTPAADWDSAFISGIASTDITDILDVVYESNAWWVKYVYDGTPQHSSSPIPHPTLRGQANATLTLDLYDGADHSSSHLLNTTNPIVIHLAGDSAIDIAGNDGEGKKLITVTSFDNISTHMPTAETIGAAVWNANLELRTYLSGFKPNWSISNLTWAGATYYVDLSTDGIVPGSSIYTFGTIRITFTIIAQDLTYWFGNNNSIEWNNATMYDIGVFNGTPILEDVIYFFITHNTGTFDEDVFMNYHTTFTISAPGRITITAQPTSTLFFGSVTFNYTIR